MSSRYQNRSVSISGVVLKGIRKHSFCDFNRQENLRILDHVLLRSETPWSKWLLIMDGTHRAALAAYQGEMYVDLVLTDQ